LGRRRRTYSEPSFCSVIAGALRVVECDVVTELRSIPTMLKMVATTQSLAFVSEVSLGTMPGLRPINVRGLTMARDIGLATRHDMPLPAASAAFATLLRARVREARPSPRGNRRAAGAFADRSPTDRPSWRRRA
jgi:hypothetical protein